jgi:hypothetical protein
MSNPIENTPPEPTPEQCSTHARIEHGGHTYFACWYPQMGGYVGKCLVLVYTSQDEPVERPCFDAYVWHDGEFPFSDARGTSLKPARLHHCGADQFIEFGQHVQSFARALGSPTSEGS